MKNAEELKDHLLILSNLAKGYSPDSREYAVLELASQALIFSMGERVNDAFRVFVTNFHSELSDLEKEKLRLMGLTI